MTDTTADEPLQTFESELTQSARKSQMNLTLEEYTEHGDNDVVYQVYRLVTVTPDGPVACELELRDDHEYSSELLIHQARKMVEIIREIVLDKCTSGTPFPDEDDLALEETHRRMAKPMPAVNSFEIEATVTTTDDDDGEMSSADNHVHTPQASDTDETTDADESDSEKSLLYDYDDDL